MAFQLTYNGKTLRLPDAQTLALLEAIYPFAYGTDEVLRQAKVGGRLAKLSPPQFYNPRIGLNQWWYPTGASRFSILRCVAAMADVEWFAASAWGEGALVPRPLVMRSDGDSTDTGFQTDMFLLPPRPVADLSTSGADNQFAGGTGSELYWLTFVDERYFWQNSSSLDQRDTGGDWSEVITDLIYTLYEGTFTFDEAVESVYGQPEPDSALYSSNENAAVLIDVMLANIGRYLVRNLDGTYTAIRYNTGINTYEASLRPSYTKRLAGGAVLSTSTETADPPKAAVVPALFAVSFPQFIANFGYPEPSTYRHFTKDSYGAVYTIQLETSSLPSPYSDMPTYSATSGYWQLPIRTTAKALVTTCDNTPPNNQTACLALAQQLAMDWIDSQCHFLDETYRGIVAVDPKIGVDILWDYSKPSTRICRLPFGYGFNDFQHSFGPQTLPSLAINQVVNVCAATTTVSGNTYVTSITVEYLPIIFNPDGRIETGTPFCVTNPVNCCTDPSVSTCAMHHRPHLLEMHDRGCQHRFDRLLR